MQQRPEPGHTAARSISSHSSEKKPVTQVPRHRLLAGISGSFFFCTLSFFSSFFSTFTSFLDSEVSITSSSSWSSSISSASSSLSLLPSWHLLSFFGIMSSLGVFSLSSKTFLATQHLRSALHRWSTSRIASQKQEILLATHTPGHDFRELLLLFSPM